MRRHKPERRAEFASLPRCYPQNPQLKGRWRAALGLAPEAELIVELAAGRADFSIGLAGLNPLAMVVAVDGKAERLWAGARRAQAEQVSNVAFLREDILILGECFDRSEISRLWITFPDPFPKARHARRRLTAPSFWELYRRVVTPGGRVDFKTDDPDLFAFTLDTLREVGLAPTQIVHDLHGGGPLQPDTHPEPFVLTAYERRWLAEGRRTHYLQVPLP